MKKNEDFYFGGRKENSGLGENNGGGCSDGKYLGKKASSKKNCLNDKKSQNKNNSSGKNINFYFKCDGSDEKFYNVGGVDNVDDFDGSNNNENKTNEKVEDIKNIEKVETSGVLCPKCAIPASTSVDNFKCPRCRLNFRLF